ncbi:MAG: DUF4402 domain-containing protein [Saprospirales bacterium]|nr:MAG: DUF4402 domain-containing protein [Saprospirales bacterium]
MHCPLEVKWNNLINNKIHNPMKNLINVLVPVFALIASGFFFSTLNAQPSQTEQTVTASANIAAPLILTKVEDMNFGLIVASEGGTVTLAASEDADRTFDGPEALPGNTGDPKAAKFTLRAHPQATVGISFDATVELDNDGEKMTLTLSSSVGNEVDMSATPGNQIEFFMGGTLNVAADQEAGVYSGEFDVTVSYQ